MPSLTVENYLKAILQIAMQDGVKSVSTGMLSSALNVLPGTVTSMLKTLDEAKLVEYTPYEGAVLTEAGRNLALRMLRRHRLIELFLVQTLRLPWDQVHEEAEHMEHAVSDQLIDRIDEYLGRPEHDPHGDPIPSANGDLRGEMSNLVPLTECPMSARVRLVRVLDQGPDFLRFLTESGFRLGATAIVAGNAPEAGVISLDLDRRTIPVGYPAAQKILVERLD